MHLQRPLLYAVLGGLAFATLAIAHPASDVSPCTLDDSTVPPTCHVVGDGEVTVSDIVRLLRSAVGLEQLKHSATSERGFIAGDVAPAAIDPSTTPETAEAIGDGQVDIADVVLLLRNAVGLNTITHPPVVWMPDNVSITGSATQPSVTRVTAAVRSDIPATTIWLTPSIADWVTVNPPTLPALTAGTELTFNLVLRSGAPDRGGTLHLRAGNRTIARPLPLHISGTATLLPPDPGAAGKATLEGIDSDGDGLRDDIQRHIVLTYPDSPALQMALRQFAVSTQAIVEDQSQGRDRELALAESAAQDCVAYVDGLLNSIHETDALLAITLNTIERSLAYASHNRRLSGQVFLIAPESQWRYACSVDPALFGVSP